MHTMLMAAQLIEVGGAVYNVKQLHRQPMHNELALSRRHSVVKQFIDINTHFHERCQS